MCLGEVYSQEDMERIVEEMPEIAPGVVRLAKAAYDTGGSFGSLYAYWPQPKFLNGPNTAKPPHAEETRSGQKYWPYYHFHSSLKIAKSEWYDSERWGYPRPTYKLTYLQCLVRKEDITAVGKERNPLLVVVASQAFFPTYPETEAKLEDFLAWQEQEQKETVTAEI